MDLIIFLIGLLNKRCCDNWLSTQKKKRDWMSTSPHIEVNWKQILIPSVRFVSKSDPTEDSKSKGIVWLLAGFGLLLDWGLHLSLDVFVPQASSCWRSQYGSWVHHNLPMKESQQASQQGEHHRTYNPTSEVKPHVFSNVLFVRGKLMRSSSHPKGGDCMWCGRWEITQVRLGRLPTRVSHGFEWKQ